jgi:hypothetical protein
MLIKAVPLQLFLAITATALLLWKFSTLLYFFGMKNGTFLWFDRTIACLIWRIILRWQGALIPSPWFFHLTRL